jgi:tetratricopeptide (TPR) repeat protein
MKRVAFWLVFLGVALVARAQAPDAEFLRIYNVMQEGETLERSGRASEAIDRFRTAQEEMQQFSRAYPSWNEKLIKFRLSYLAGKIGSLSWKRPEIAVTRPSPLGVVPAPSLGRGIAGAGELERRVAEAEEKVLEAMRAADEANARANTVEERSARLALDLRHARDRLEVLQAAQQNLETARKRLETERTTLQARLREALAPKPASLDPAELGRAQERNLLLTKENEILKASLDHQMAENKRILETAAKALELEKQLGEARGELVVLRRENNDLRGERQKLVAKVEALGRKADPSGALRDEIEELKRELAAARGSEVAPQADAAAELASLRSELADQRTATRDLRAENATLARELERLTAIKVPPGSLRTAELPGTELAAIDPERVRRLEQERDDLRRALDEARSALARHQEADATRTGELNRKVEGLQARIATLEAKAEPYSPEELALFQAPSRAVEMASLPAGRTQGPGVGAGALPASSGGSRSEPVLVAQASSGGAPAAASPAPTNAPAASPAPAGAAPSTAGADTGTAAAPAAASGTGTGRRRTLRDLPPGASILAAQAQRAFVQRRFEEAEKAYREILSLDEQNVFTLGNLAAILVERGRLEEGEALLSRALNVDAEDPFSLSLRGIIRFRQQRYDEAFEALSKSAQLDPDNADTQNYLGITLSQRGQRKAAEAALRKALKLSPTSPAAHYNLAVVYATQKPPFLELARYHYEKARRSGQPANPAFEGVLRGEIPTEPPAQ